MSELIGQSIGRYHITEQLGQGGMATVFKAFDTHVERDVAVKFIRSERLSTQSAETVIKRFKREAQALAKLSHPNILTVLDYGEHEGQLYLVTEFMPGGTLKEKLGKQIHWAEAAKLLAPIARALEYAHGQGIIHRDIKPANILISPSGLPILADFGIAKMLESELTSDLTGTNVGVGTPDYMAPEQGLGKGVDHRPDDYALGIVFYEMITGRKPYTADTPLAAMRKQAREPPPPQRVCARPTRQRRENNFQSGSEETARSFSRYGGVCNSVREFVAGSKPQRAEARFQNGSSACGNRFVIVALIIAGVWFAPNQPAVATPTPTTIADAIHTQQAIALATNSVLSTNIALTPTATPAPTNTPLPTNTPTPAPTPMISEQKRVVRSESLTKDLLFLA